MPLNCGFLFTATSMFSWQRPLFDVGILDRRLRSSVDSRGLYSRWKN
ncbi:hypothetical protein HMPREF0972_01364 [Actinomyces sp. oral taxon 848 str. F0332]|nr:hypothetical protein HMPREF0972_01364 [Actinomyces sp. oral taxon 848 str. F0332]